MRQLDNGLQEMGHMVHVLAAVGQRWGTRIVKSMAKPVADGKRQVLQDALNLAPQDGAIIEIGCLRHEVDIADGSSTILFAAWAAHTGQPVHSVDQNPDAVILARRVLEQMDLPHSVDLICCDGAQYLRGFQEPIALLYLDGSDHPLETLDQLAAVEERLLPSARIVIDDCHAYNGNPLGKGTMAIPFLQKRGWDVRYHSVGWFPIGRFVMAEFSR